MITSTTVSEDVAAIGRISAVPKILEVVAKTTGLGFAAIARVTETTWTACAVRDQPVVFGHASRHPHFSTHHTPKLYGLGELHFRADLPRQRDVLRDAVRDRSQACGSRRPHILKTLEMLAQLIGAQLEVEEKLELSEAALTTALDVAKLREEFIAIVGHDLRNPIQAVLMDAYLLKTSASLDSEARDHVISIENSAWRMSTLVADILDFAHGRLGDGIPIAITSVTDMEKELRKVVSKVAAAYPQRALATSVRIDRTVECDPRRIGQLFSNLIINAVKHGESDRPIEIEAATADGLFTMSVVNRGTPIPRDQMPSLFQPFSRSQQGKDRAGLGLGLFIAAEVARAHGGRIDASSDHEATRFTFTMPLSAPVTAS